MTGHPAVLIVAHGSRRSGTTDILRDMATRMRHRLGNVRVDVAFLEHGTPAFRAAVESCYAAGVRRLVVLPFFLLPGVHVTADLPAEIASARRRFPALRIVQADFLGGHPALGDVLCELFLEAMKTAQWQDG
jgi:sirohydrochlorin ferrochelatase